VWQGSGSSPQFYAAQCQQGVVPFTNVAAGSGYLTVFATVSSPAVVNRSGVSSLS
jgi:hypothetical protein